MLRVALAALVLLLVAFAAFVGWALTPLGPGTEALEALEGDGSVEVTETGEAILFVPRGVEPTTGVVIYPGGRVDARSYAPLALEVARRGHLVAITPMPLNLAVFAPGRAGCVVDGHPGIERWVVGGHSLGGAMAAAWLEDAPSSVTGLALLAAYPPAFTDLAETSLAAVSLRGSADRLVTEDEWLTSGLRLPPDARLETIEGGNHAQFGDYGIQPGDGDASITASEQWQAAAREIDALFR